MLLTLAPYSPNPRPKVSAHARRGSPDPAEPPTLGAGLPTPPNPPRSARVSRPRRTPDRRSPLDEQEEDARSNSLSREGLLFFGRNDISRAKNLPSALKTRTALSILIGRRMARPSKCCGPKLLHCATHLFSAGRKVALPQQLDLENKETKQP